MFQPASRDASQAIARSAAGSLPQRGEFVIRNGFVLTMDGPDIPNGAVHVRNGEIVAVGADVNAPGVDVIDATDMTLLTRLRTWPFVSGVAQVEASR